VRRRWRPRARRRHRSPRAGQDTAVDGDVPCEVSPIAWRSAQTSIARSRRGCGPRCDLRS
jgi:hypothetical protein